MFREQYYKHNRTYSIIYHVFLVLLITINNHGTHRELFPAYY